MLAVLFYAKVLIRWSSSSDFLSNLLVLLIRIMNSGLSDSGLLAHLSEATAGTLSGVGHSSAYEELSSYSSVLLDRIFWLYLSFHFQTGSQLLIYDYRWHGRSTRARGRTF